MRMSDSMDGTSNEAVNLLHEESTLRILAGKMSMESLIQSNKMYLLLVGLTEEDIKKEFRANYTTLNWLLDLEHSVIYMDFGFNRQKLTRSLLNKIAEFET